MIVRIVRLPREIVATLHPTIYFRYVSCRNYNRTGLLHQSHTLRILIGAHMGPRQQSQSVQFAFDRSAVFCGEWNAQEWLSQELLFGDETLLQTLIDLARLGQGLCCKRTVDDGVQ